MIDVLGRIPYNGKSMDIHSIFSQLKWEAINKYLYVVGANKKDLDSC